ncbi:TonB-dependent receptor [Sphingomonas oleivorans]|nr:TonB-dependent receptor [Sphingomonas oleivorans]
MQTRWLKMAASMLALVSGSAAWAQTAEPAGASASEGFGDIVVTASKRPETQQRTALALSVLTPEVLQKSGTTDVLQLSKIAPGLNLSQNANSTLIAIRGVSSRDYSEVGDPAVSISIDGTYIQRAATLNAALFDIARVEVLRGPQGTLYGRNATGGAINIITAKAAHKLAAAGSIDYGNYDALRAEAMVNLPVTDTLAVRVSGLRSRHDGYRDNAPAKRGDDENIWAGRISAQYDPTAQLSATLTGEYIRQRGVGSVRQGVAYPTDAGFIADLPARIPSDRKWALDKTGFNDIDIYSVRGALSYDFGFATLAYTGGYRHARVDHDEDYEGTAAPGFGFPQDSRIATNSHELRLTSNGSERFSYQLGGFFFRERERLDSAFTEGPFGYYPDQLYDYHSQDGYKIQTTSKAAFAQLGYEIIDDLKIEGGIRFTRDNKKRIGQVVNIDPALSQASGTYVVTSVVPQDSDTSFNQTTYHVGANYQLTPANMIYAKFDTGYKAGGFTEIQSYRPEKIKAYEVGSKNRFVGNKIQANISLFYYDYRDQQISQFLNNQLIVANAGKSTMYGGELETDFMITLRDRFNLSVAYLDAKFDDFLVRTYFIPSTDGLGNAQLAGNTPIQAPKISLNVGYEHDFAVGDGTLNARVQTQLQSESHLSIYNFEADRQAPYSRSDVVLTYTPANSPFSIQAYVRNLEDSRVLTAATPNFTGNWLYQFAPPRTYGGRVSVKF